LGNKLRVIELVLMRMISSLAALYRGRSQYGKYKKLYKRDLLKVPSFKLISSLAYGRILDVGCGIGYLSKLFNDYVGIDINKEAIAIAKRNTNSNYIIASATHLPFRSNVFDTCISYDVIEHVKNVDPMLTEMKRVSKKAIISCVDFNSYYRFFTYDETHQKLLTPNELLLTLKKWFAHVRLFRTSGLFLVPYFLNAFLSRYLPNQVVLEACKR